MIADVAKEEVNDSLGKKVGNDICKIPVYSEPKVSESPTVISLVCAGKVTLESRSRCILL